MNNGVTFFAAFIGGALTLLPSCGPLLLPAFFAYSFKEKRSLISATAFFGLGFALVFIPFGFGARFIASILLQRAAVNDVLGAILIVFALLAFSGKSISIGIQGRSRRADAEREWEESFFLGIAFSITAAACSAPIFGAIATLAASRSDALQTFFLLLVFVLGMLLPLFALAAIFESTGLMRIAGFVRKPLRLPWVSWRPTWANLVSGVIFAWLGILYLGSGGGSPLSGLAERLGIDTWFLNMNDAVVAFVGRNPNLDLYIGLVILLAVIGAAIWFAVSKIQEVGE